MTSESKQITPSITINTNPSPEVGMTQIPDNSTCIEILRNEGIVRGMVLSFRSIDQAHSAANRNHTGRNTRPKAIVFGDNEWYWVVSEADAERLEAAGYDIFS